MQSFQFCDMPLIFSKSLCGWRLTCVSSPVWTRRPAVPVRYQEGAPRGCGGHHDGNQTSDELSLGGREVETQLESPAWRQTSWWLSKLKSFEPVLTWFNHSIHVSREAVSCPYSILSWGGMWPCTCHVTIYMCVSRNPRSFWGIFW